MSEEDIVLEAFTEFLNAVEAGIAAARQLIKTATVGWDPDKIKWEQAEGSKGSYERSDDVSNPEHKAMVKDLAAHGGRMTHEGLFYWLFENGSTVGRKKRGKGKEPEVKAEVDAVTQLKAKFPEDLSQLLMFDQDQTYVIIKPREYLGSENFARIASIVREAGGSYLSEGKNSRFEIPKQAGK